LKGYIQALDKTYLSQFFAFLAGRLAGLALLLLLSACRRLDSILLLSHVVIRGEYSNVFVI